MIKRLQRNCEKIAMRWQGDGEEMVRRWGRDDKEMVSVEGGGPTRNGSRRRIIISH